MGNEESADPFGLHRTQKALDGSRDVYNLVFFLRADGNGFHLLSPSGKAEPGDLFRLTGLTSGILLQDSQ